MQVRFMQAVFHFFYAIALVVWAFMPWFWEASREGWWQATLSACWTCGWLVSYWLGRGYIQAGFLREPGD